MTDDGGFTVQSGELTAGGGLIDSQEQQCGQVGSAAAAVIAQLAGAAGHPGLADALAGASETVTETFLVAGELYAHVADGLRQCSATYDAAEQAAIASMPGLR